MRNANPNRPEPKRLTTIAYEMGKAAFSRGDKCVPAFDKALCALLKGPVGSASPILQAWMQGFTVANLAANPIPDADAA